MRSGGRVVEGARLESEYTSKAYRGFESLPLRQRTELRNKLSPPTIVSGYDLLKTVEFRLFLAEWLSTAGLRLTDRELE